MCTNTLGTMQHRDPPELFCAPAGSHALDACSTQPAAKTGTIFTNNFQVDSCTPRPEPQRRMPCYRALTPTKSLWPRICNHTYAHTCSDMQPCTLILCTLILWVTRRKLQTPGTAEEHKRHETPTIKPIDRQPIHLTDHAPSTIERAAQETHNSKSHSSRARFSTATTRHHHRLPTGSSPDPHSQRSPLRSLGAALRRDEPHYTTDTTRLSRDTQRPPTWGAHHQEWPMDSQGHTASLWKGEAGRGGEGGGNSFSV